jgi:hypothetical protein
VSGVDHEADLDQVEIALDIGDEHLFSLDKALALLAVEDPKAAQLVILRFFGGGKMNK